MDDNNNTTTTDNGLSSLISDSSGGLSSTRIVMLAWTLGVLSTWMIAWLVGVFHGIYVAPAVPDSIITLTLGIVGGKVIQRPFEK